MKYTAKLLAILLSISSARCFAQSPLIKVKFEVEGIADTLVNKFDMKFISGQDTVKAVVRDGGFIIPAALVHKKAGVLFYTQQYKLDFSSIFLTWNPSLPQWTIGIDTKPFEEKKPWSIKKMHKIKTVYYIDDNLHYVMSEYRYKLIKPIKRL